MKHGIDSGGSLTQRQEAFCLAFIKTGNASEAYRRAYSLKSRLGSAPVLGILGRTLQA